MTKPALKIDSRIGTKADRKPRRSPTAANRPKTRDTESQGIRTDQRGQDQPADKTRAQKNR